MPTASQKKLVRNLWGSGGDPEVRADLEESGGHERKATQVELSRRDVATAGRGMGFIPVCALHKNIKNFRPTAVANRTIFFSAPG